MTGERFSIEPAEDGDYFVTFEVDNVPVMVMIRPDTSLGTVDQSMAWSVELLGRLEDGSPRVFVHER